MFNIKGRILNQPGGINIIAGEDHIAEKSITLVFEDENGNPVDLTLCSALQVRMPAIPGNPVVTRAIGTGVTLATPLTLGHASLAILAAQSSMLNVAQGQDFEVVLTINSEISKVIFAGLLSVSADPLP